MTVRQDEGYSTASDGYSPEQSRMDSPIMRRSAASNISLATSVIATMMIATDDDVAGSPDKHKSSTSVQPLLESEYVSSVSHEVS